MTIGYRFVGRWDRLIGLLSSNLPRMETPAMPVSTTGAASLVGIRIPLPEATAIDTQCH